VLHVHGQPTCVSREESRDYIGAIQEQRGSDYQVRGGGITGDDIRASENLNCSVLRERVPLDGMEKRHEPRRDGRIVITVTGRDKIGQPFAQAAIATSVSDSGGLLSGITRHVRPGDLLWIEHRGKRSRFKVVWVRDSDRSTLSKPLYDANNR
jgi:hypothetical protein